MKKIATMSMLLLLAVSVHAATLVQNGKSTVQVSLRANASPSETMAKKELEFFLRKITKAAPGKSISTISFALAGRDQGIPADILKTLKNEKSPEAFFIRIKGEQILIAAKQPVALLYGAYHLLEKYLGIRWFFPGEQGEYVPQEKNITLSNRDDFQKPDFRFRRLCVVCVTGKHAETTLWQVRNRMNPEWRRDFAYPEFNRAANAYRILGGHAIWQSAVPDSLYATHPEYFPLIKGKRTLDKRAQRCVSNPDVKRLLKEYAVKNLNKGPEYVMTFGVQDDVRYWCACDKCREYGTVNGKYEITNAVHRLYSEVCAEILKEKPDARLWAGFYINVRPVPSNKNIRYDERIDGDYNAHQICCAHEFSDPKCPLNVPLYREFTGWIARGPKVNLRGYYSVNHAEYAPLEYTLAKDLKHLKKLGAGGWWEEVCAPNAQYYRNDPTFREHWLTTWRYFYAASKLLWDSSLDIDKLMEDANIRYYGKAAPEMKKFRAVLKEAWDNAPGHAYYGGPYRVGRALNAPGVEKALLQHLAAAKKAAAGDKIVLERLAMDERHLKIWGQDKAAAIRNAGKGSREIPASRRTGKIVIDGNLDETDWKRAAAMTDFLRMDNQTAPAEETRVKVLYDNDSFYIAIQAMTENFWGKRAFKTDAKKHDGNVWEDDSCEIMIAPPCAVLESGYNHWIINTTGVVYDAKARNGIFNKKFDSKAEIKVKIHKDSYVIEMRVPASDVDMKKISSGDVWKMHFVRSCNNLQPPNSSEGAAIDGHLPHRYDFYRRLMIGQQILPNGTLGILVPRPKHSPTVSEKFPKDWGGKKAYVQKDGGVLLNDFMSCWMGIPQVDRVRTVNGEITVCGKGKLYVWASTCVRRPDQPAKPFRHEIRHDFKFDLSGKKQVLHFTFPAAAYEQGYFYISGRDAVIYSATASVE